MEILERRTRNVLEYGILIKINIASGVLKVIKEGEFMKKSTMVIIAAALVGCAVAGILAAEQVGLVGDEEDADEDPAAGYKTMTMAEAAEVFATPGDYIILDVRRADEFAAGHIPGAVNVANEDIDKAQPAELPDLSQKIYVYCRSGRRSKLAAAKLVAIGYTDICEIGGIIDWTGEIEK